MPPRSQQQLLRPLPDLTFRASSQQENEHEQMCVLAEQNAERLACEHLALLKKRVAASIAALPADLQVPVWRRVRFDGVHLPVEFPAKPAHKYYWLEPPVWGMQGPCCICDAQLVDCADRLPPLGWSRWIYTHERKLASKVLRVRWDVRPGEMLHFFEWWGHQSLMTLIQATDMIEESRDLQKRLSEEGRAASALQLCVDWDAQDCAREERRRRLSGDVGELHFTEDGWAIVDPILLSPRDMMLLSKHEVNVLARRPKLKQFIFDHCTGEVLGNSANTLDEARRQLEQRQRQIEASDHKEEPDAEEEYRSRDIWSTLR